jgi:hypothetical protein
MERQIVNKMLPNGRVCIHWFQPCDDGPINTEAKVIPTQIGPLKMGGVRGRIACNPSQNYLGPLEKGMQRLMCHRSEDPRAVTCPACMDTPAFKEAIANFQTAG